MVSINVAMRKVHDLVLESVISSEKIVKIAEQGHKTISRMFKKLQLSSPLIQKEDTYDVYINGKREERLALHVNNFLRKNKNNFDLWIDVEVREVRANKQPIKPTPNSYKLLVYIAKNVGRFCPRSEIFKAIWGISRDDEDPDYSRRIQTMFSRNIYKLGSGILKKHINGENRGYRIYESLNSCLISRTSLINHFHPTAKIDSIHNQIK